MDVSRITQGKIELARANLNLAHAVRDAIETSRTWIDSAQHRLLVSIPSRAVIVDGDMVRLTQIFANLLNNAAKYTPDGGNISITLGVEGKCAVVIVVDDGIGIEMAMQSKVFETFAQIPQGTHRTGDGLGIGLSLVERLVRLHGGSVSVHSEGAGKGSTFKVSLPLAASTEDPAPLRTPGLPTVEQGHRVLVVDDNRDAADSIALLFSAMGCDVEVAYGGSRALELIEQFQPTISFIGIGMPEMNGYELARLIRAREGPNRLHLVALTGWGQEQELQLSIANGFDEHLIKPVELERLRGTLARKRTR